jgi:hypothetical protein
LSALGALYLTVCSPRETVSFWWNAHALRNRPVMAALHSEAVLGW